MSDRSWDRLSGLLVGAALGLVAGMLLAPDSGETTRKTIKERTQKSLGQFRDSAGELRETLNRRSRNLIKGGVTEIEISDQIPASETGSPDE